MTDVIVLLGAFTLLCLVGVPIAYALGLAAMVGAFWIDIPLEAVMLKISDGSDEFALLAIPFFVLAGAIMAEGGIATRLVNLARLFVGTLRGGWRWSTSSPRRSSAACQARRWPIRPPSAPC
jgi:TRAP-type mannitol/chloroaromatic compound transport system permease large subunit